MARKTAPIPPWPTLAMISQPPIILGSLGGLAIAISRSVAQRAHVAAAPALDGVVGEDGAADVVTGAHCDRRLDPADRHGLPLW